MLKNITVLVIMTLSLSIVSGFMISQPSSLSASKVVRYGSSSDDEEWKNIIGSEYNIEQYLGEDGWRYRMAKTEDEIKAEGDYTFFQRMFGATSNNKVRLAAREDARENYQVDAEKQALNNEWIMKYGYKRFYPSYLDKAALSEKESESMKKKPVVATPNKTPEQKKTGGMSSFSMPSFGKSNSAEKTTSTPKATKSRPAAVKVSAPTSNIVESSPISTTSTSTPRKMTFTVSPVKKNKEGGGNLNLMKSPRK